MNQRFVAAALVSVGIAMPAAGQLLGPTPYLSAADSPFDGGALDYFYVEDFEDGALSGPGVAASAGAPISPGATTDSVDADDGAIDGKGTAGHSFYFVTGSSGIKFTFDAGALGHLPTHAGVVWTDGAGTITFEAFDASGASLGKLTGTHADGTFTGGTAEDRFYGVVSWCGVSAIKVSNSSQGIEVDHLQYGYKPIDCRVDCNADCKLNVNDFICFQAKWRSREGYGDFDGSGTFTVNDFIRFQAAFVKGCS